MTAAANRDSQLIVAAKVDSADHVSYIRATCDQRRAFVDHGIVDFTRLIVAGVTWLNQVTAQLRAERADSLFGKLRGVLGSRLNGHGCSFINMT